MLFIVPLTSAPEIAPTIAPLKAPARINPATPPAAPPVRTVATPNPKIIRLPISQLAHWGSCPLESTKLTGLLLQ